MSERLTVKRTTIPAFIQAVKRYRPLPGLIFHSDRGIQYACDDFRSLLKRYKAIQSMSGKGNCYDNAVAESFFHTLKTELIYHQIYHTPNSGKEQFIRMDRTVLQSIQETLCLRIQIAGTI